MGVGTMLARWAMRQLPADWRLLRRKIALEETVLVTLGLVQVRRTRACVIARTAERGERAAALRIALRRLVDYADGANREGLMVPTARPAVQRPDAPGRWLVQISLPGEYTRFSAPVPYDHKVRILAQPTETLAVMRLPGRVEHAALVRGEATILTAIANRGWSACGTPLLRLQVPPGLLPWSGSCELAVPVSAVPVTGAPVARAPLTGAPVAGAPIIDAQTMVTLSGTFDTCQSCNQTGS